MARNILINSYPPLLKWAEDKLREKGINARFDSESVAVAVDNGEQILGCVIFHGYNGANVQMSIVTTCQKWAGKDYIHQCFEFAFKHLGVAHISTFVREDNQKSLTLTERLGFTVEGKMRSSVMDMEGNIHDGIVFGMLKQECRWL